jgi:4-amino-4-deoxy-L-arabinose transferase-like glycosyltransferase
MIKDRNIIYLLSIGVLSRLVIFFIFYNHITTYPDSLDYQILFEHLKIFNLEGYNGWRSPGYPLLLLLANGNLQVVVFFQLLIGIVLSIIWYKTFINLTFNKKKSFYLTLFLLLLLNVIFYETTILSETFTLFFLSITIYLLSSRYFENNNYKKELLLGLVLGFLVLIKPFFAFIPFLIYGFYILKKKHFKSIISPKLIIFIFPLVSYFGWSYVNKINNGYFVPTTFFGLNIAQNCVRFAEKGSKEFQWIIDPYITYREKSIQENRNIAYSIWYAYHEGAFKKYDFSFANLSYELGEYGKSTIKRNPFDYLKQVVFYSWLDFWKPSIFWEHKEIKYGRIFLSLIWYLQFGILYLIRGAFVLLSIYYLYQFLMKKNTKIATFLSLLVLSASVLQAMVTYGSNSRYSFPFEFIMVMVVAHFLKNFKISNYYNKLIKKRNSFELRF